MRRLLQCSGKICSIFVGKRNGLLLRVEEVGEKNILFLIFGEFVLKMMVKSSCCIFDIFVGSVVVLCVRGGGIVCLRVS